MTMTHEISHQLNNQFLTLWVNKQLYGIPVRYIKDIFTTNHITKVPLAGPEVAGVANLRGRIVTALDLHYIISGLTNPNITNMNIAVEWNNEIYSLIVDSVSEVLHLSPKDLEPVLTTMDDQLKALTSGIYKLDKNLLVVLDIQKIFTLYEKPREEK